MAQTMRDVYELQGRADVAQLDKLISTLDNLGGAIADMDRDGRKAADGAGIAEGALSRLADATIIAQGAMSALAGVAGMVGGAFSGSVGAMLEQEAALRNFRVATGATADEMAAFRDNADAVFTSGFGDDLGGVLHTMQQVERITGASGTELEHLTRNATIFADVFETDVAESVRAADTASENFAITNAAAMDVLAAGFQKTGDPAGDLADTFNEYSANFAQMEFGADQFLDVLNQGLESGARNTDDVADAFREFQIRLMDGASAEAIAGLGPELQALQADFAAGEASAAQMSDGVLEALRAIEDPVARNAAGVDIFGTRWEDMGEDVLLGIDPIREGADTMEDLSGTMTDAQRTLQDGIGPAWRRFTRVVQTGMIDSLEPLGPFLNNTLTPALEGFGGWLSSEGVPALVDFSSALVDNAGFALANFGRAFDKLQAGNLTGFMASMRTAFDALGTLNIGATLTSAIAEPVKAWFAGVDWGALASSAGDIGGRLLSRLFTGAADVMGVLRTNLIAPMTAAIAGIDWANEIAAGDGSFIRVALGQLLGGTATGRTAGGENSGGPIMAWVTTNIAAPIGAAIAGIDWATIITGAGTFTQDVLDTLTGDTIPDLTAWATDKIGTPVHLAVRSIPWSEAFASGASVLNNILNAMLGDGGGEGFNLGDWATNNIGQPMTAAIAGIDWATLFTGGANVIANLLDGLTASVSGMGEGEGEGLDMSWLMNAMTAGVANMWGEDGAIMWTKTNLIDPIFAGLANADYSALGESLGTFGSAVAGALVGGLPEWGTWVMETIIQPIVDGLKGLPNAIKGVINDAVPEEIVLEFPSFSIPNPFGPGESRIGGQSISVGPIPNPFPDLGDFATGGSFVVPGGGAPMAGSSDQKFAIGLTPGERVDVTPRGSGGIIRQPVTIQLNGQTFYEAMIEIDADSPAPRWS